MEPTGQTELPPEQSPSDIPDITPAESEQSHRMRVEIDVAEGDVTVTGRANQVTLVTPDTREVVARQMENDVLRFDMVPAGSELHVPSDAEVVIHRVYGNLAARHLDGALAVHHVNGDVHAIHVAAFDLLRVDGGVRVAHAGPIQVGGAGGDVELEDVSVTPVLGHINGRLRAASLSGLDIRDAVNGDVILRHCGEVLIVGSINGDLRADDSIVTVRSSSVAGDMRVERLRGATIAAVGGDITLGQALEPVDISSVGGRVAVGEARNALRFKTVGDDLLVNQALGGLVAQQVRGDVKIETPLSPDATYTVFARGDIALRVSGDAVHAKFVAQTTQGEIHTRLPLAVERGRRRNLVGVLGRGTATVTLRSEQGDIFIAAADSFEEEPTMGDEYQGDTERDSEKSWEGTVAGKRFRVRWDKGPGKARVHFQGPFTEDERLESDQAARDFNFEWERGHGARVYGEYEQKLNELRDRAEKTARRAAEQAQDYAERATKRARETDWEAVGREVRMAFERAMSDVEDAFNQFRREWDTRRPAGAGAGTGKGQPGQGQRVRIEYDDQPAEQTSAAEQPAAGGDTDSQRRAILEQLRTGAISIEEAERRLSELS